MRAETELWIATLLPDKVALYRAQHQPLPTDNMQDLIGLGYALVKIFEEGMDVYMLLVRDSDLAIEDYSPNDRPDSEWRRVTDACFARPWRRIPQIFCFSREVGHG